MMRLLLLLATLLPLNLMDCSVVTQPESSVLQVFKEYCEAETFRAACPMGHVIVIRHAQYGRMRIGRCVIRDYGYVGCSVNVLTHMDAMCSGNQICDVRIPDPILDRVNICPKDFKTYLEIGYVCTAVNFGASASKRCREASCGNFRCQVARRCKRSTVQAAECSCGNETTVPVITGSSGYISSQSLSISGCRVKSCPLLLRVPSGQQLNITLWDFTLEEEERDLLKQQLPGFETCYRYAVITETSKSRSIDVCGGWRRVRPVYQSVTNQIEIQLIGTLIRDHLPKFLLKYEAFGCTDFEAPSDAWVRREEDSAVVGCLHGGTSYRVMCINNVWVGTIGTCPESPAAVITDIISDETAQPPGIFLAIVVCLAFTIGAITLTVGLIVIRRRRFSSTDRRRRSSLDVAKNTVRSGDPGGHWPHCQFYLDSGGHHSLQLSNNDDGTSYNEMTYAPTVTTTTSIGGDRRSWSHVNAPPPPPCPYQTVLTSQGVGGCCGGGNGMGDYGVLPHVGGRTVNAVPQSTTHCLDRGDVVTSSSSDLIDTAPCHHCVDYDATTDVEIEGRLFRFNLVSTAGGGDVTTAGGSPMTTCSKHSNLRRSVASLSNADGQLCQNLESKHG